MKKVILLIFSLFLVLISLTGCKHTVKNDLGMDRPYENQYSHYDDMEDDIDLFIKDNGQTKPFMLFKNISTSYRLGGICKYYKLGDITYIERENCSRATNLYNMRTYLIINYNGNSKYIELFASFEIDNVDDIYYESDASKLTFEVEKAKSPAFACNGKPIVSIYLEDTERNTFLEYLKQELLDCGYVKS